MKKNDLPEGKQYVLYVINKGNEIDKENVSNADLEYFSSHKVEKEILFYPFSSFIVTNIEEKEDIKKIEKIRENDIEELTMNIKYYRIELSYIGKYKKDVPPEIKSINESVYAKALLHTEILKKEELVDKPEMFTFDIKKYMNIIIAYYTIPPNEKKNKIKLIKYDNSDDSCQMYINDELVDFENEHIFDESKEYKIKFEFNDKIKSAGSLFENCKYLTSINLSYLNLENVSTMTNMFQGCTNLKTIEFNNSNTQNIIRMNSMFYDCKNLTSIDLSKINCENVRDIESMFRNCKNLKNVKFFKSNKEINSMNFLFYNCSSLNSLDLSQFDCPNAGELGNIFGGTFNKNCSIIFKENSILDIKRSSLFD
jgi:surface protein